MTDAMMNRNEFTDRDAAFMREALDLARTGEGRVAPNPPVGCVLVKNGIVVGRGWHDRYGDLHAEAAALRDAGDASGGSTCYVTLSPCATAGRQPPCVDALIRAGVARVVAATVDPNPKNMSGLDVLREAGVPAESGLLREDAEYLARGFFKMQRHRLPYLTLKYAMTMDGKIAAPTGDSRWVSGPESRALVQDMRSRSDVVLVGSGTAVIDDPLLNVREPVWSARGGAARHRQPLRIIADTRCRVSPRSAIFQKRKSAKAGGPVVVACGVSAEKDKIAAIRRAGAEVVVLEETDNRLSVVALLRELAGRGVNHVLCEGGGTFAAGLIRGRLVDEIAAFVAPKLIGGDCSPGPVGDLGLNLMSEAVALRVRECKMVGGDIFIRTLSHSG